MKKLSKLHHRLNVTKLVRVVAVATILSLLVVAIPATPALATEDLRVTPEEGEIGDRIRVNGYDYDLGATIYIYFSSQEAEVGERIDHEVTAYKKVKTAYAGRASDPEEGEFHTSFGVPEKLTDGGDVEDVRGGEYYVYAIYSKSKTLVALAKFIVIGTEITIAPEKSPVATEVEITGSNFADREKITIKYDGKEVDIASGDEKTDRYGEFTSTILIPESTAGKHSITVTDESGSGAEQEFTVKPEITLTPTTGATGDTVIVNGTGFSKTVDVSIKFEGDEVASDKTDEYGSFEVALTVPVKGYGSYYVEAKDEDNNKDEVKFTLAGDIKLSQTMGNVGTEMTISGSGFMPNAVVAVSYDAEPTALATTITDANGEFLSIFTVPKSKHGEHTITATDGTSTASTTFTMESTLPPTPLLLLPQMGAKVKSQVYFDWEDVSDPSGVTYTLQVATDDKFTTQSIVVEKTELAKSEYTLAKEKKLKSTTREAPYYWRVQAVDGAANESGWTIPESFYIGFTFELTGWVLYTSMALAGLLLLFIGFLLGRRTAYI